MRDALDNRVTTGPRGDRPARHVQDGHAARDA